METYLDKQIKSLVEEYFNDVKMSDDYIKFRVQHEKYMDNFVSDIRRYLNLNSAQILDVGCGAGGLSVALALNGARITAIDTELLNARITSLRTKKYPMISVNTILAVGEKIPLRNRFDAIILKEILEHVEDVNEVLHEVKRLLKEEGIVYATVPSNLFSPKEIHTGVYFIHWLPKSLRNRYLKIMLWSTSKIMKSDVEYFKRVYCRHTVKKILRKHGFEIVANLTDERLKDKIRCADNIETHTSIKKMLLLIQKMHLNKFIYCLFPLIILLYEFIGTDLIVVAKNSQNLWKKK